MAHQEIYGTLQLEKLVTYSSTGSNEALKEDCVVNIYISPSDIMCTIVHMKFHGIFPSVRRG